MPVSGQRRTSHQLPGRRQLADVAGEVLDPHLHAPEMSYTWPRPRGLVQARVADLTLARAVDRGAHHHTPVIHKSNILHGRRQRSQGCKQASTAGTNLLEQVREGRPGIVVRAQVRDGGDPISVRLRRPRHPLRRHEASVGELLQLVPRPGQVPHEVPVEPRLLRPSVVTFKTVIAGAKQGASCRCLTSPVADTTNARPDVLGRSLITVGL